MTESQIIMSLAAVITAMASTVSVIAGIAWRARGETIADLKESLAKATEALNVCRNDQIAELKSSTTTSNENLNAATAAAVAATNAIESSSEVLDRTLQTVQKNAADLAMLAVNVERIARQTEACPKSLGRIP